jgi:hypothetical protein
VLARVSRNSNDGTQLLPNVMGAREIIRINKSFIFVAYDTWLLIWDHRNRLVLHCSQSSSLLGEKEITFTPGSLSFLDDRHMLYRRSIRIDKNEVQISVWLMKLDRTTFQPTVVRCISENLPPSFRHSTMPINSISLSRLHALVDANDDDYWSKSTSPVPIHIIHTPGRKQQTLLEFDWTCCGGMPTELNAPESK